MESTQGTRWEALCAATIAVMMTAGMFWSLARLMRLPALPAPSAPLDDVLDAVWIVREPPRATPAPDAAKKPIVRPADAHAAPPRSTSATVATGDAAAVAPVPAGRSLTAVYLMQARGALAGEAPPAGRDPFADRAARLPGEGRERFRMRTQTSVATVVNGIGRMFGGGDPDEACRENRRNIGDLALDGDSAALQQQLDYERRLCRP